MHNHDHDLRLCAGLNRRSGRDQTVQLKAAGCEKVFREKITGTTADRPQLAKLVKSPAPGDVVITPAVDRLSRDTTDLLVIARDMQRAGAGIRSLAEPLLDTTSDFAEIIFAILGVAAKQSQPKHECICGRLPPAKGLSSVFVKWSGAVICPALRCGAYDRRP
jgi:Resolvase, N terminal domain